MAAITALALDKSSIEVFVGTTAELVVTKTPEDGTGTLVWSSSDEDVATVADGVVTAVAEGTATITVAVDGAEISASAGVTVNVLSVPEFTLDEGKISAGVYYINTIDKV